MLVCIIWKKWTKTGLSDFGTLFMSAAVVVVVVLNSSSNNNNDSAA